MFDKDKSGMIKVDELRQIFHAETGDTAMDKVIEEIIFTVDKEGDGKISHKEFVDMMHHKSPLL